MTPNEYKIKRTKAVQTTLTPDEYKRLVASACFHNRTIADYIRLCVIEQTSMEQQLENPAKDLGVVMLQEVLGLIVQKMDEHTFDIERTYFHDEPGTEITMPCHPIGHLLLAVQGGIIKKDWVEDAQRWLAPLATASTVRTLCQYMWPKFWIELLTEEIDYATQATNNDEGEEYFIPNLVNAKEILNALSKGLLTDDPALLDPGLVI